MLLFVGMTFLDLLKFCRYRSARLYEAWQLLRVAEPQQRLPKNCASREQFLNLCVTRLRDTYKELPLKEFSEQFSHEEYENTYVINFQTNEALRPHLETVQHSINDGNESSHYVVSNEVGCCSPEIRDPCFKDQLASLCNGLTDRWHFPMVNDATRNLAFKRAIESAIRTCRSLQSSGHRKVEGVLATSSVSVLDIGCGTGLLRCVVWR